MQNLGFQRITTALTLLIAALTLAAGVAYASHSWGGYHWARTANPFTLKLGDNVSSAWDSYLQTTSSDWSQSSILDTNIVPGGTTSRQCRATNGRVEVCNRSYGANGWLGVASIWVSGSHITKGTVKVNDTYFKYSFYNTPAWRNYVMCQEVGHTFGLDHQDENNTNPNLGSCMDYTNDPDGPPSNEHPNAHDYEQLEAIYSHLDSITTLSQTNKNASNSDDVADNDDDVDSEKAEEVGEGLRKSAKGKSSVYEQDLGKGKKVFTFIIWAE